MVQANEGLSTNQISKIRIPSSTNQYNIYLYTYTYSIYIYIQYILWASLCIYTYMECQLLTGFPHRCLNYTSGGCFLHGFLSSPLPGGGRSLLGDTMITEVDVCDGAGLVGLVVGWRIGGRLKDLGGSYRYRIGTYCLILILRIFKGI